MRFADLLKASRKAAGLTQADLGRRSGVARPNITTYEGGRREPLFASAMELLDATGARLSVELPVRWTWTDGLRPYAVPSRLWRLPTVDALRSYEPGLTIWWSGAPRTFDLASRGDRCRAYEVVLREGSPADIEGVVDELLLCDAWADLVLPRPVVRAWAPLVSSAVQSRRREVA